MFYVYILRCRNASLYVGYTQNIEARVKARRSSSKKGRFGETENHDGYRPTPEVGGSSAIAGHRMSTAGARSCLPSSTTPADTRTIERRFSTNRPDSGSDKCEWVAKKEKRPFHRTSEYRLHPGSNNTDLG